MRFAAALLWVIHPVAGGVLGMGGDRVKLYSFGRATVAGLTVLGLVMSSAVPGALARTSRAGSPIVIGAIAPLTGEVAIDGQFEKNGYLLAVQQINAAGGVNGRKLSLKLEDGACDPAATASAAQKLISRDRVVAFEGAFCSSATAAAIPLADRFRVPYISAGSTAVSLTAKNNPWFSRLAPTEALMGRGAIPYLVRKFKFKTAAIVTFNDDYGLSYAQANTQLLRKNGVKVLSVDSFGSNTQDFSSFVSKIKSEKAKAVFVAADTGPEASFFKQMYQLGLTKLLKGSAQVAASAEFIKEATPKAANGIFASTPYVAVGKTKLSKAFDRAYQKRYGIKPESDAAQAYDYVYIIANAIKRAKSTNASAVQRAIRSTNMNTIQGRVTFNGNGQGESNFFFTQIQNGKIKVIKQLRTNG